MRVWSVVASVRCSNSSGSNIDVCAGTLAFRWEPDRLGLSCPFWPDGPSQVFAEDVFALS